MIWPSASDPTRIHTHACLAQQLGEAAELGEQQFGPFGERKEAAPQQRDQLRLDGRERGLKSRDRRLSEARETKKKIQQEGGGEGTNSQA